MREVNEGNTREPGRALGEDRGWGDKENRNRRGAGNLRKGLREGPGETLKQAQGGQRRTRGDPEGDRGEPAGAEGGLRPRGDGVAGDHETPQGRGQRSQDVPGEATGTARAPWRWQRQRLRQR